MYSAILRRASLTLTSLLAASALHADTLSIAEVHEQRESLAEQQVTVEGEVVKVNNGIMNRNFIHLEDGSGEGDTARLIVTSQDTAEVGDVIEAAGTVVLDTDFGMGYFYPTLVEESSLTSR